jgi:hypothetical protein
MAISQERFEEIVQAVAARCFKQVRVTGFTIWVTVKSRSGRSTYEVYAEYDPESDHWNLYDPYRGLTLSSFVPEVHRAMRYAID